MNSLKEKKYKFDDALEHLKKELNQIRTGRANPAIIENIMVDYYGTKTPLNQMANISAPDPRSLLVQPWDTNVIKEIEKAVRNSDQGMNPVNEGNQLRVPIPALTEERRKELAKVVNDKVEQAKVSVRNIREEILKEVKEMEKNGEISEDEMFAEQKELQKVVDEFNSKIKEIGEEKENDILTL